MRNSMGRALAGLFFGVVASFAHSASASETKCQDEFVGLRADAVEGYRAYTACMNAGYRASQALDEGGNSPPLPYISLNEPAPAPQNADKLRDGVLIVHVPAGEWRAVRLDVSTFFPPHPDQTGGDDSAAQSGAVSEFNFAIASLPGEGALPWSADGWQDTRWERDLSIGSSQTSAPPKTRSYLNMTGMSPDGIDAVDSIQKFQSIPDNDYEYGPPRGSEELVVVGSNGGPATFLFGILPVSPEPWVSTDPGGLTDGESAPISRGLPRARAIIAELAGRGSVDYDLEGGDGAWVASRTNLQNSYYDGLERPRSGGLDFTVQPLLATEAVTAYEAGQRASIVERDSMLSVSQWVPTFGYIGVRMATYDEAGLSQWEYEFADSSGSWERARGTAQDSMARQTPIPVPVLNDEQRCAFGRYAERLDRFRSMPVASGQIKFWLKEQFVGRSGGRIDSDPDSPVVTVYGSSLSHGLMLNVGYFPVDLAMRYGWESDSLTPYEDLCFVGGDAPDLVAVGAP